MKILSLLVDFIRTRPKDAFSLFAYVLLSSVPTLYFSRNSDPIPKFLSQHPDFSYAPVSGWYGPGTWLALLATMLSGGVTLLDGFLTKTPPTKWSPDIFAVLVYSATSCVDLYRTSRLLHSEDDTINFSILPSFLAASRATTFCAGVLEVYSMFLFIHFNEKNASKNYVNIILFLAVWITSILSVAFVPPYYKTNELAQFWPCDNETPENICRQGRDMLISHLFLVQPIRSLVVALREEVYAFYFYLNISSATPFIVGIIVMIVHVLASSSPLLVKLPKGFLFGIVAFYIFPIATFLAAMGMIFASFYPVLCVFTLAPSFALAALPGGGVFPYSGTSILELDQLGSLFIVLGFHAINIVGSLGKFTWSRAGSGTIPEEETELQALEV
ncbi:hypothetical protein DL96DRAFT_1617497 [Flagelloscypha sp. PMI_526]|nr:hypothetical protein DL96DRAFT_1617497 [Flagelloscypha sp. PMI_526]